MSLLRLKSKEPLKAVSVKSLERLVVYEPIKARGNEPVKATVLKGCIFSLLPSSLVSCSTAKEVVVHLYLPHPANTL